MVGGSEGLLKRDEWKEVAAKKFGISNGCSEGVAFECKTVAWECGAVGRLQLCRYKSKLECCRWD